MAYPVYRTPPSKQITPEEQLDRLLPVRKELPPVLKEFLIPDIIKIVVEYSLDPRLTRWKTSLGSLGLLPRTVPALPPHILLILNGRCLIFNIQHADGSYHKVLETQLLAFIPAGLTIKLFEKYMKKFFQNSNRKDIDSFKFKHFFLQSQCENFSTGPAHWELITLTVLPESPQSTFYGQEAQIAAVTKKVNYRPLSLPSLVMALFLYKLETGENLYPTTKNQKQDIVFTRVQESIGSYNHFVVGLGSDGMIIDYIENYHTGIGSGVRRIFL